MIPPLHKAALMVDEAREAIEGAREVLADGDVDAAGAEMRELWASVVAAWDAARLLHGDCEALFAAHWTAQR